MIGVDAAVAKEGPVAAGFFALGGVALDDQNFLFIVGGFGEDAAEGIGDEGVSPELETGVAFFWFTLVADAIDYGHVNAVGDGVRALDSAPGVELSGAELGFFMRMPADAGGIENDLRALESGEARTFRIPLVPADLNADASVGGIEIREAEIARREIELFVIEGIVGDVHFAVFAEERAIGVEDGARVVVNAGGAALEERSDEDHFSFFCDFCEGVGRGTRDWFGEIEKIRVFGAAKIFAGEKFVETDDLSATRGRFADLFGSAKEIFFFVGGARHLHETDRKFIRHANYLNTREFFECERELFFPSVKVCTINSVAIALQSRNNAMGA